MLCAAECLFSIAVKGRSLQLYFGAWLMILYPLNGVPTYPLQTSREVLSVGTLRRGTISARYFAASPVLLLRPLNPCAQLDQAILH